jgi:hypothetical protein
LNKQVAQELAHHAQVVATRFSQPDRAKNFGGETFTVREIRPLSEYVAAVFYLKSTGKLALALFYYIPGQSRWEYFFPTDSHLLALPAIPHLKAEVEKYNYQFNLKEESH